MLQSFHFAEEDRVASPALVYYKEVLEENTKRAIAEAGGADKLWPHVKSHKSADVLQMQTKMGICRFKCATIAEAEMAAQSDATDILLAYPLVGPNIDRFVSLVQAYPEKAFYALGDHRKALEQLSDAAVRANIQINCLIDVNTGMNRTGVDFKALPSFYEDVEKLPGLCVCGLHCYDGDRHEKDYREREEKVIETIKKAMQVKNEICARGGNCKVLIMGGSPSFPCYAQNMENVYFSPGTVFVYDAGYTEQFPDLPYEPGAAVLARVVSHPADGMFTLDCGYKAISAEQHMRGILPEHLHAKEAFQSEEHWTFCMEDGYESERPDIGTVVYIIPWHVCPTTALYEKIQVVEKEHWLTEWQVTARSRELQY